MGPTTYWTTFDHGGVDYLQAQRKPGQVNPVTNTEFELRQHHKPRYKNHRLAHHRSRMSPAQMTFARKVHCKIATEVNSLL